MNGHIYMLFCQPTYRYYVGKSRYPFDHPKAHWRNYLNGSGYKYQAIFKAVKKYGADNFTSICLESDIPEDLLNCREKFFIRLFHAREGGYNRTNGGDGLDSETARENARKCVENGTHNFLNNEIHRQAQRKRVSDGTHNFLGISNPSYKRVVDGTHNLLGKNNPVHKQISDGTHNFLDSEFQQRAQIKRDAVNKKRLEDGTHHFLGDKNPAKRLSKEGRHPSTLKRQKAEWCYIIALSRFYYEIHDYTLKRRAEFLSKDIPDTSHAEQEYLF